MPVKVVSWKLAVRCSLNCSDVCYICNKKASEGCINSACPGACAFVVMACGHGYHSHCISPTNTDICFVCRSALQKADLPSESTPASLQKQQPPPPQQEFML
ncbi:putative modified RING finger protein [Parapoxvirus red deer/HL953]|uniref:Putative modified RING finger protein n=1 Tax=Parapoxvirus red deer/HL953 TaxID=1579460 RepID=A0A0A7M9N5_9POXV|nr:putative modified RING finger protein [Parapoxvirus red deer/HL953]AIZ77265.1 putative modified RING finger protein [Parapoxvirus red deer/HL953]